MMSDTLAVETISRRLVKIGWKDEGTKGPVTGYFSDGTRGRLGDSVDIGGGIKSFPWYTRGYARKLAREHGVPFEEF